MKNILVISHNCMNSNTNMGLTMKSIFKNMNDYNLYQLYFKDGIADEKICKSSFCLTDKEIIKNIFKRKEIGTVIDTCEKTSNTKNKIKSNRQNRLLSRKDDLLLYRDFAWDLGKWRTKTLKMWLDSIAPDVIIFFCGPSIFPYKIVKWITHKMNIKCIYFMVDDFYINNSNTSIHGHIQYKRIRKYVKQGLRKSNYLVCYTESMSRDYKKHFNDCNIISYYPTGNIPIYDKKINKKENIISYLGNLDLERWKTIIEIGKILDKINNEHESEFLLEVYSSFSDEKVIKILKKYHSIIFKGYVSVSEVSKIISESKYCLHVESFDKDMIKRVKYSFSTKIINIMSSSTCLIAVGPNTVESVSYIKSNNCGYVIDDMKSLKKNLEYLLFDVDETVYINNAKKVINKNHNNDNNTKKLRGILEKAIAL